MGGHRVLDIICMMIYANLLHGMPDPWGAGISAAEDGRIRFLVILIKKAVRTETQQRPVLETNTFLYKQMRFWAEIVRIQKKNADLGYLGIYI